MSEANSSSLDTIIYKIVIITYLSVMPVYLQNKITYKQNILIF